MKILNLYAGIGGNRKHWSGCEVTAVEYTQKIADVYARLNPNDTVVVADAHQYLLDHYHEFDFIWSSPPCQSHSRMIRSGRNRKPRYPDFKLYEEIVFLFRNCKDKLWVVENVIPYYTPLIEGTKIGRHLFWSNFDLPQINPPEFKNFINEQNLDAKEKLHEWLGIHYEENIYYEGNHCPTQILRNCVHPDVGREIFNEAKKQHIELMLQ
jgi:DNA (cytosine-5)-methyltransferase 1